MMIEVHLNDSILTTFMIKRASLKRFYLYMKLLQSSAIKIIMKCLASNLTTPNSKNIITTLPMVTIENLSWHYQFHHHKKISPILKLHFTRKSPKTKNFEIDEFYFALTCQLGINSLQANSGTHDFNVFRSTLFNFLNLYASSK